MVNYVYFSTLLRLKLVLKEGKGVRARSMQIRAHVPQHGDEDCGLFFIKQRRYFNS